MNLISKFYQEKEEITNEEEIKQSPNILNWYPFTIEEKILMVEKNLAKAKEIAENYKNVENIDIVVGNINEIELKERYDIIILLGITPKFKLTQIITHLENTTLEDNVKEYKIHRKNK